MDFLRRFADPTFRAQQLEILLGILGFFTLAAFVVAVLAELRGQPAVREALVLLLFVVLTGAAWRARQRAVGEADAGRAEHQPVRTRSNGARRR